ncbi:MAG: Mur ligase family protein, partial [Candidatus Brocadiales bacterium]|nr:Mur ligase family protein [Candidatus Brocadiales bacterium]
MEARSFKDKRVTVMGLGLFGGGAGLARFLVSQGARVVVTDLKDPSQLSHSLASLKGLPIEFHLGGHHEEDFRDVDMVMVNPAVPKDSAFLGMAREKGVRLETEMNLFFKLCPAPIIGITGSKGKSTTTALLGEMLSRRVKTWVGGNIGRGYSLLEYIDKITPQHLVVLELSSFQLEDLREVGMSPHLSIVTNITNNHLDRHKSLEDYIEAKKTIIHYQGPEDFAVLNYDDPELRRWSGATHASVLWFS